MNQTQAAIDSIGKVAPKKPTADDAKMRRYNEGRFKLSKDHIAKLFSYCRSNSIVIADHDARYFRWVWVLGERFDTDDMKWLCAEAKRRGFLPSLEVVYIWLSNHRAGKECQSVATPNRRKPETNDGGAASDTGPDGALDLEAG